MLARIKGLRENSYIVDTVIDKSLHPRMPDQQQYPVSIADIAQKVETLEEATKQSEIIVCQLQARICELIERQHILSLYRSISRDSKSFEHLTKVVQYPCGVISNEQMHYFERIVYRVSRGNSHILYLPINDRVFHTLHYTI